MDQALLRFYYVRPELLRNSGLPGIERAAIALEIQCIRKGLTTLECDKPRDSHGHFYGDNGAQCPHNKGIHWENWGKGRNAADDCLMGRDILNAMKTKSGISVNFLYDKNRKFGLSHTQSKSEERNIDKICETIAFGEKEEITEKGKLLIRYNGYIVVLSKLDKRNSRNLITGYPEDGNNKSRR
ncbi:MAG: hypothetical protein SPI34_07715 [Opitutales bacterium]|nr:hypothetical protein [Opitutales bacterium]